MALGPERKRTVYVHERPQVISVHQRSKTVWVARGEYMSEWHESRGRSANAAADHWREWARYKGNG